MVLGDNSTRLVLEEYWKFRYHTAMNVPSQLRPRKTYQTPRLEVYGDLQAIVQAKPGNMADSVGGSTMT